MSACAAVDCVILTSVPEIADRRCRAALAVLATVLALAASPRLDGGQSALSTGTLPKVRLIATGGTISNRTGGRLTAEELIESMRGIERYARTESEQFANTSSAALTLDQWLALARRINTLFADDPELAGIVVTSGTDTLEETAYFLNLTVRSDKPVVVVGSMRNPSTLGYEGAANLLEGFRVAAEPRSRGRGVLVVLNDEINAAREATKTDALRLQTFQTRGYGVLGVVDSDRVVYYRDVVKRHTSASEFDVSTIQTLPRVDVVMVYQGASGDVIKAMVDQGAKGIVIASAGAGATSGTQNEGIRYAIEKGVAVVTSTRTGGGRIAARSEAQAQPPGSDANDSATQAPQQRTRRGRIAAEDLAPLKARILLMLALATTQDDAEIQRMFTEY
jgi:L-asparaginase